MHSSKKINVAHTIEIGCSPTKCDLAITSIDIYGNSGRLNWFVLTELGYSEQDLPTATDLGKGFHLVRSLDKKSILFVVTVGTGDTSTALRLNLRNALLVHSDLFLDKKIWIPLMGTGDGELSFNESLNILTDVLNSLQANLVNSSFTISIPEGEEGNKLYRAFDQNPTKRYWAGGFGRGEQFYDRLEDFKRNNYWQALDYDEDSNPTAAENAWSIFHEIKIGDWFLIKGYGGNHSLTVHYIGEVTSKNIEEGRLIFKPLELPHYKGDAPRGEGAGNWRNTLLEVLRSNDIEILFGKKSLSESASEPSTTKTSPANLWMICYDSRSWPIEFQLEENYWFHKNYSDGSSRKIEQNFNDIKKGDQIFLFSTIETKTNSWFFVLTRDLHDSVKLSGEIIEFQAFLSSPIQLGYNEIAKNEFFQNSEAARNNFEIGLYKLNNTETEYLRERFELDESVFNPSAISSNASINNPDFLIPDSFTLTEGTEGVIGVDLLASVMSNLLKNLKESDKGKMVGIFGNWGRGKTFLMDKIWEKLEKDKDRPFIRVNFHAWKYQDTPASWAYLFEAFSDKFFEFEKGKSKFNMRFTKWLKLVYLNIDRIGWWPLIKLVAFSSLTVLSVYFIHEVNSLVHYLLFFGFISLSTVQFFQVVKRSFSAGAKELFKKYYTKTSFASLLGVQSEIQKELKLLLAHWIKETDGSIKNRILLFVDDIDRCSEERIILIIDALRVMLEDEEISKRVVVIAAIDERVLKRAIKGKYHDLLIKDCEIEKDEMVSLSKNITNEYMDKLFLSGINLGVLTANERRQVLVKYIGGRVDRSAKKQSIAKTTNNEKKSAKSKELGGTDLKLESTKENPQIRPVATDSENDNIISIDGLQGFELSEDEENILLELMDHNSLLTPRQIRIFYYRYLLARNILVIKLHSINKKPNKLILVKLASILMHYTLNHDLAKIKNVKIETPASQNAGIEFIVLGKPETYDAEDLILIHDVLEAVISY